MHIKVKPAQRRNIALTMASCGDLREEVSGMNERGGRRKKDRRSALRTTAPPAGRTPDDTRAVYVTERNAAHTQS